MSLNEEYELRVAQTKLRRQAERNAKDPWAALSKRLDEIDQLKEKVRELEGKLDMATSAENPIVSSVAQSLASLLMRATEPKQAPGLYFLIEINGAVCYVGQSKNVMRRMAGHINKDFHACRMVLIEDAGERIRLENSLIATLRPKYNQIGGSDGDLGALLAFSSFKALPQQATLQ